MKQAILITWLAWTGLISAQSVYWKPDRGTLSLDQGTVIQLNFENCQPDGDVEIAPVDGLILSQRGSTQQVNIVNFDIQRSTIYTFMARPTREGKITIPAFKVSTDKGEIEVPAAEFEARKTSRNVVAGPNNNNRNVTIGGGRQDQVQLRLTIEDGELWEGEVARAEYVIKGWTQVFAGVQSSPNWNPDHLLRDGWNEKIDEFNETVSGRNFIGGRYEADVMAEAPGTYDIDPVDQVIAWRAPTNTGISTFDRLFSGTRPTEMQSNPLRINVKALPENAPDSFTGAVGDFQFSQEVVPAREVKVGEPITWTVKCHGRGNWPMGFKLPNRTLSNEFRVIQPKSKLDFEESTQFRGTMTEDMVLVPKTPGTYTLKGLEWTYFDPKEGAYRTLRTEPVTIKVVKADAPAAGTTPALTGPGITRPDLPDDAPAARMPELSSEVLLPRGWMEGSMSLLTPWPLMGWTLTLLAPLPVLIIAWLIFAWSHAPRTDRNRNRRQAWQDLQSFFEGEARTDESALKQWRRLTCRLWEVPQPVPGRGDIEEAVRRSGDDAQAETWGRLWEEGEAQLFHARSPVPEDWSQRARQAHIEARVRRPGWWHAFYPRNLLPGCLALFLIITLTQPLPAQDADEAYRQGQYPESEELLRRLIIDAPQDAAPRYNLGLTLMQQERWEEALAWTLSSWLQAPGREEVAWNLQVASREAEVKLDIPDPESIPAWFSPRQWQMTTLIFAWLGFLGLLALMIFAYRQPSHRMVLAVISIAAAFAFLVAGLALWARSGYGLLADPSAAMLIRTAQVRSIPTEVSEQILLEAPPGLATVVEKEFLGWRQIRFASGQSGWVRKSELVPLYRPEP